MGFDKEDQFILMVQTGLINNMIKQGKDCKRVIHTLIDLEDAFYAAKHIPENMSLTDAVHEFLEFACNNLRDEGFVQQTWYSKR